MQNLIACEHNVLQYASNELQYWALSVGVASGRDVALAPLL